MDFYSVPATKVDQEQFFFFSLNRDFLCVVIYIETKQKIELLIFLSQNVIWGHILFRVPI